MDARTEELHGPTIFAWSISAIPESTKESQLPTKFPVIVDDLTGTIFEPGLLFLYEKYVEPKFGPFRYNTVTSYAHDLKEWCRHLEQYEVAWPKATRDDLNTFIKVMYVANSTETGKPYCTKTIISVDVHVKVTHDFHRILTHPFYA